jgi:Ca2+-binding RTX toxin-like protein
MQGQAGSDDMSGGAGDDGLSDHDPFSFIGNNILRGGTGDDFLSTSGGNHQMFGNAGNDNLHSDDNIVNNDFLDGGPDTDTCESDPDPEVNCEL